ncbi:MAG: M28 family peptidase [Vicinamibacteria bacterium]
MDRVMLLGLALLVAFAPGALAQNEPHLAAIYKIKQEAFEKSQLADTLFYLTDVHGPRLTGSPGYKAAAAWAISKLADWGLTNPRLETWGQFGRGWSYSRLSIHMLEPVATPLHGVPMAWCSGTEGPVIAETVFAPFKAEPHGGPDQLASAIENYAKENRGKLKGKIILMSPLVELELPTEPATDRLDAQELETLTEAPEPMAFPPFEWPMKEMPSDPEVLERLYEEAPVTLSRAYWEQVGDTEERLIAFLLEEGVTAVLSSDSRGDGAILYAEGSSAYEPGSPVPPPSIVIEPEQYNRIVRLVDNGFPVRLEIDLAARFHDDSLDGTNVIAEIPGGTKRDEIVMMGAHLDSWHAATGATDNAAGSAVVLEAARILKAISLPMDRTVRLALWDGEEQGLYGSLAYVKNHFADPKTMELKPEHAKMAAYFNIDNGSGKIRGVFLQKNDLVRPIFEAWLAPFADLGATSLAIRNTTGTDHQSFDEVGLPGFQFIQDPLDYGSRTHHSHLDVYDHLSTSDLMQAAAILASFVYEAANRAEMLPRKPLPKPVLIHGTTDH